MSSQTIRINFDHYRMFFIIVPALLFQFVGSIFYFVIVKDPMVAKTIYTVLKMLMIVWPIFFVFLLKKISFATVGFSHRMLSLVYGGLIGLIIFIATYFLSDLIVERLFFAAPFVKIKAEEVGIFLHNYVLFAFFLSTFNAFFEEYYWRWFVMRSLATAFSPVRSIVISAFAFSAHHVVVLSQFFPFLWTALFGFLVFVGGILFGLIYQKTHSLVGSVLCHFAADAALLFIGYKLLFFY